MYRVYVTDDGYNGLSHDEKVYFSLSVFEGEYKNGGLIRFFQIVPTLCSKMLYLV